MVFHVPDSGNRPEPTEEQKRATRGTAAMASKTVADSVETDRQQEQALHLIERWGPDREGLEQAAISLGVDPLTDEEIRP
ncbi:hypothetical protein ACOZ38_17270 [Sphaerisporangium viridialbum]|uniref:hypothetical protein n=1 Tax=Sphaerisporangium viridialbum TaxID=46189 RepID=UPI003C73FAE4